MAITVATVSPSTGLTGGRTFVVITGTGFATTGQVRVLFGAGAARGVRVRSSTTLDCRTPIMDRGTVNVVVENVSLAEQGTLVGGYTYREPDLAAESPILTAMLTLIIELRRQTGIRDIFIRTAPDYHLDQPPKRQTQESRLPQVILRGPRLVENRFDSVNERVVQDVNSLTFKRLYEDHVVDVEFDVVVRSKNSLRHHNLVSQCLRFFHQNPYLNVPLVPSLPAGEQVVYELKLLSSFSAPGPSPDDLRSGVIESAGVGQIRGVLTSVDEVIEQGPLLLPGAKPAVTMEPLA